MWLFCYSTSSVVAMPKLKWSDYCRGPCLIPCSTRTSFSLGTSVLPCHHYSTNGPCSYVIDLQLMLCSLHTALLYTTLPYLFLSSLYRIYRINIYFCIISRFPNRTGTNKCWMNSSLQTVFGMKPFIQDLLNTFEETNTVKTRGKYSSLVETFILVVKAKQRKNQLQLNKNLE